MKSFVLKTGLSLVLLIVLYLQVDKENLLQVLSTVNLEYYFLAFFLDFLLFVLAAYILYLILTFKGLKLPITQIYKINVSSMFYSILVPGDIASAYLRWNRMSRLSQRIDGSETSNKSSVFSAILVERIINMGSLLLPFLVLIFFAPLNESLKDYQLIALAMAFIYWLLFFLLSVFPLQKLIKIIPQKLKRISNFLSESYQSFKKIQLKDFIKLILLFLLFQVSLFFLVDVPIAKSIGLDLPWWEYLSIVFFIRFLRYLPITLSGIGLREGLFPYFLSFYGVPFEQAFMVGLAQSSLIILTGCVGGLVELKYWYGKK